VVSAFAGTTVVRHMDGLYGSFLAIALSLLAGCSFSRRSRLTRVADPQQSLWDRVNVEW